VIKEPIALALVRKPDGTLLALQGLGKLDLPGVHVPPGARLEVILEKKLLALGVSAPRLFFRWGAIAYWGGVQTPVSVFEAARWTGTPTEDCSWATEVEIAKGPRSALYRRLFEKLRLGVQGRTEDAATVILEGASGKPRPTPCPKCGAGMRLRNRRVGAPALWDCGVCASSWSLAHGAFARESPVGG